MKGFLDEGRKGLFTIPLLFSLRTCHVFVEVVPDLSFLDIIPWAYLGGFASLNSPSNEFVTVKKL